MPALSVHIYSGIETGCYGHSHGCSGHSEIKMIIDKRLCAQI